MEMLAAYPLDFLLNVYELLIESFYYVVSNPTAFKILINLVCVSQEFYEKSNFKVPF